MFDIIIEQKISRIAANSKFKSFSAQIDEYIEFVDAIDFQLLPIISAIKLKNGFAFGANTIIGACLNRLFSIKRCCEIGHFSDCYILIRKLRDDFIFYIYLQELSTKSNLSKKDETFISDWYNGRSNRDFTYKYMLSRLGKTKMLRWSLESIT